MKSNKTWSNLILEHNFFQLSVAAVSVGSILGRIMARSGRSHC